MEGPIRNEDKKPIATSTESSGEPKENLETQLGPEVLEKIMEKVQDINKNGTAYHAIEGNKEEGRPLEDILRQGLLGQELNAEENVFGRKWAEDVHRTKKGFVYFNIVGRSIALDPTPEGIQEENEIGNSYYNMTPGRTTIVFDMSPYKDKELVPNRKPEKSKSRTFRSHHPYSLSPNELKEIYEKLEETTDAQLVPLTEKNKKIFGEKLASQSTGFYSERHGGPFTKEGLLKSDTEFGFVLSYRVSPRLFRGIVLYPSREKTDEETNKELEELFFKMPDGSLYYRRNGKHCSNKSKAQERKWIKEEKVEDKNYSPYVKQALSSMLEADKERPDRLLPIYSIHGDLLWPKQMSHEEVKRFVEERDKEKENEKGEGTKE